ncbi:MAG: hypothetical protein AAFV53_16540 [Myxococcota bacterium]
MAQSVKALRVEVEIEGVLIGDDGARQVISWSYDKTLTAGEGADQVSRVFQDQVRALTSSSSDIDFGTVEDFEGNALGIAALKVLAIRNLSTTASELGLLDAATSDDAGILNGTNPLHSIGPGGLFLIVDPGAAGYAAGDSIGLRSNNPLNVYLLAAGDTGA